MKRNRVLSLLLAATLLFSLCFTGCAGKSAAKANSDPNGIPVRMQNGGKLRFLPEKPLTIPKLSEMVYTRPDTEKLIDDLEALTEKVHGCDDAQALLKDYYGIAVQLQNLESMDALAFYRYTANTADSSFSEEYDYCEAQYAIVEEKENDLYAAFAASPCREALEQAYFGEGFFLDYEDYSTADETYFDLKQQEKDLLFQYYELAGSADFTNSRQIERNHEVSGNLLIALVKVRKKIAAVKGYENYMDYSYACDYQRDYTTAQARAYLDRVKTLLAPLTADDRFELGDYSDWNESKSMEILSSAAERMGGPIWEACRFMTEYGLYDIDSSSDKMSIGYTNYIGNNESPYLFVDPDTKDLLTTLFHEFGHFTDFYCNYGSSGNYEISETYSQAMQYLAFVYSDLFPEAARKQNLRAVLADLLVYSILQGGAFADFELQIYAMEPEELTLDRLDETYAQCMKDYGIADMGGVRFKSNFWSVYQHFFSVPGYVISYSDSALASLQICRMESEEPGTGVKAFCRLLTRTHGKKFAAVLAEAGLDSPFEEATVEKTAQFLKEAFEMN